MWKLTLTFIFILLNINPIMAADDCADIFNVKYKELNSRRSLDLCKLTAGKTVLIVNTASHCGFTPQFEQLQAVYRKYQYKDFIVIGFPSNDFYQESKDPVKTAQVCYINYGVKFPMTESVAVRGSDATPLFKQLAKQADDSPNWNFHKYLVSPTGKVIGSWGSSTKPNAPEIILAIENNLPKKAQAKQSKTTTITNKQ